MLLVIFYLSNEAERLLNLIFFQYVCHIIIITYSSKIVEIIIFRLVTVSFLISLLDGCRCK